MTTFANTNVPRMTGGVPYAAALTPSGTTAVMPSAEGDLYNVSPPSIENAPPIPCPYHQAGLAVVEFTCTQPLASNLSYVVWQGNLGDAFWFDLAWCTFTLLSGTASFLLSIGAFSANAVQQTRTVGTAPTPALGNVQCTMPDLFRFVGKASVTASSSASPGGGGKASSPSAAGAIVGVTVSIRFKMLGLR
jgi:hypothetical protein